jgi:hypothetical protein
MRFYIEDFSLKARHLALGKAGGGQGRGRRGGRGVAPVRAPQAAGGAGGGALRQRPPRPARSLGRQRGPEGRGARSPPTLDAAAAPARPHLGPAGSARGGRRDGPRRHRHSKHKGAPHTAAPRRGRPGACAHAARVTGAAPARAAAGRARRARASACLPTPAHAHALSCLPRASDQRRGRTVCADADEDRQPLLRRCGPRAGPALRSCGSRCLQTCLLQAPTRVCSFALARPRQGGNRAARLRRCPPSEHVPVSLIPPVNQPASGCRASLTCSA